MGVERGLVAGGNPAHDFAHEAGFDGGELSLDGTGDVQAGGLPVGEREIRAAKLRGEGGTTKRSPGKVPRPMTMAGRTLWLLKSVKGMGRSTTSLREQGIVGVVGVVVPRLAQAALGFR